VKAKVAFVDAGLKAQLAQNKLEATGGFDGVLTAVRTYIDVVYGVAGTPPTHTFDDANRHRRLMISHFNKLLEYPEHWETAD
jgi:hypothetical protein